MDDFKLISNYVESTKNPDFENLSLTGKFLEENMTDPVDGPGKEIDVYYDPLTKKPNAEKLMKAYRLSTKAIRNKAGEPLMGLIIDIDVIIQLVKTLGDFQKLYVALAASPEGLQYDSNGNVIQSSIEGFTTIFFGIDSKDKLLVDKAVNFCDPCPPKCPCEPVKSGSSPKLGLKSC